MCFWDGYNFLIINKNSGEKYYIHGDKNLIEFFEGRYAIHTLFHRLLKKEYVHLRGTFYRISYNSRPECQRVKMELIKTLGIEDYEHWKCPEQYISLLKTYITQ